MTTSNSRHLPSGRPHSLLLPHGRVEFPRTHGEALHGFAAGCLACQELAAYLNSSTPVSTPEVEAASPTASRDDTVAVGDASNVP